MKAKVWTSGFAYMKTKDTNADHGKITIVITLAYITPSNYEHLLTLKIIHLAFNKFYDKELL